VNRFLATAILATLAAAAGLSMAAVNVAGNGPCGTRTEDPKECSRGGLQVTFDRGSGRIWAGLS
jgi:hypothetical protein